MKYDLEKIKEELDTLPSYDTQIYLQGDTEDMDSHEAIKNYLLVDDTENDFNIPLFDLPYINSIMKKHNLVRTRVMKMAPKTCYSYHQDPSKRVHIPLITNEKCFFVVADEVIRLPADGNYYVIDTTKLHTFVNASFEDRIHIVGCQYD